MNETNIHTQTNTTKTWDAVKGAFVFSFQFTFATKEQYLAFRRQWKENYAELSHSLRGQKQLVRSTMRQREPAGPHQVRLLSLKSEATLELLILKAAKAEANRQYLAQRIGT